VLWLDLGDGKHRGVRGLLLGPGVLPRGATPRPRRPGGAADVVRCLSAVFGHAATAWPRPLIACAECWRPVRLPTWAGTSPWRRTLSGECERDKPGTLYVSWLFEPGTTDELVEDIYMHTLPLGILAAIQRAATARVTWPQDDEIAARAVTAAVLQQGGVQ